MHSTRGFCEIMDTEVRLFFPIHCRPIGVLDSTDLGIPKAGDLHFSFGHMSRPVTKVRCTCYRFETLADGDLSAARDRRMDYPPELGDCGC
jgi:hypothetical protein